MSDQTVRIVVTITAEGPPGSGRTTHIQRILKCIATDAASNDVAEVAMQRHAETESATATFTFPAIKPDDPSGEMASVTG